MKLAYDILSENRVFCAKQRPRQTTGQTGMCVGWYAMILLETQDNNFGDSRKGCGVARATISRLHEVSGLFQKRAIFL